MKAYKRYFNKIKEILEIVEEKENKNIEKTVDLFVKAIENKNSIFTFGASHAGIISEELFYRAGGLALINPIFEPSIMLNIKPITFTSEMESLVGYGELIADKVNIKKDDIILCHSVSGRNCVMIDFVNKSKEKGAKIIALTNVSYSSQVKSRHPSGKRLMDIADIIIDNHGEKGDATIKIEGLEQKVSPTSTVIGSAIVNSMVAQVAEQLINKGITPPILFSANIDGGKEHNNKIFKKYKDSIYYL